MTSEPLKREATADEESGKKKGAQQFRIEENILYRFLSPSQKIQLFIFKKGLEIEIEEKAFTYSEVKLTPLYKMMVFSGNSLTVRYAMDVGRRGYKSRVLRLTYNRSKGKSWLNEIVRGTGLSKATVDKWLDILLDSRILKPSDTIMECVKTPYGDRWVRTYYIANEALESLFYLFLYTHKIVPVF